VAGWLALPEAQPAVAKTDTPDTPQG